MPANSASPPFTSAAVRSVGLVGARSSQQQTARAQLRLVWVTAVCQNCPCQFALSSPHSISVTDGRVGTNVTPDEARALLRIRLDDGANPSSFCSFTSP